MSGNQPLALPSGIIAAAGLETVGIAAAHWAVDFYSRGEDGKARTAVVTTAACLIIGISGIVQFENTAFNAKVTGVVMFIIAAMVYVLLCLSEYSRKTERAMANEQERAEAQRAEQTAMESPIQQTVANFQ